MPTKPDDATPFSSREDLIKYIEDADPSVCFALLVGGGAGVAALVTRPMIPGVYAPTLTDHLRCWMGLGLRHRPWVN